MFSAGYEGIAEYYVDAVPTDAIALGALAGVAKLDPALTYESRDGRLVLAVDGRPVAEFVSPAPDDIRRWALVTSAALDDGRQVSKPVQRSAERRVGKGVVSTGRTRG